MIRVFILYAVSGFVSLGYQVAWFRIFTDWFGSTNLTFALVVCNFIAGLGVGALLSERLTVALGKRLGLSDRLRVYGIVELLVGVTVLLTILVAYLPADLWGSFPYTLRGNIWDQNDIYRVSQVIIAAACVFIPCVFMGVTFPLICNAFVAVPGGERFPAALYAWNTLGACTGVLACQFMLLPWIGHSLTFWMMAGLNLCLGAYFLLTGGAPAAEAQLSSGGPGKPSEEPSVRGLSVLLTCAALSGLLSGVLEGDMFKRISFAIQQSPGAAMSFISFWAILAIFLASFLVHRLPRLRLWHIKIAVLGCVVYYAVAWEFTYTLIYALTRSNFESNMIMLAMRVPAFPASTFQLFYFVGIIVFPAYFLISLLLPYVCNRMQAKRRHLGFAYGLNTLAFCIGMIGFTLIAPRVNIFYSLKLSMLLLICGAVLLLLISDKRRLAMWKPVLMVSVFAAGCFLVPSGFDPNYMQPGSIPTRFPVGALKSNGANTTFVVSEEGEKRLFFGNLSMSGTNRTAQTYMRLMAHFPLLAQAEPKKALLICLGVGNTASAIAAHDTIEQIDIVDLNDKVIETAPEFSATNYDVHLDSRVRFIHDDGRNYLQLTDEKYDLITSEPPPPMAMGVYRLYSREYYQEVLAHLTPDGMMTQWLPIYQMPADAVRLAITTFIEVFPSALLFVGHESELILIGSRSRLDLDRMQKRFFESDRVVADLRRITIMNPLALFALIMRTDESLHKEYGGLRQISDEHNDLEHLYLAPAQVPSITYDPIEVVEYIAEQSPELAKSVEPIVTHLGRLRYQVPWFPVFGVTESPEIALSDADWARVTLIVRDAELKVRAGNLRGAVGDLVRAIQLAPEDANLLMILAEHYLQLGAFNEAITALQHFQRVEPEVSKGHGRMGEALLATRRTSEALREFRIAVKLDPGSPEWLNNTAWILATNSDDLIRDPVEAVKLAKRAADITDNRIPSVLDTLGVAYASAGDFDEAIAVMQRVLSMAVELNSGELENLARQRISMYENREPLIDPS